MRRSTVLLFFIVVILLSPSISAAREDCITCHARSGAHHIDKDQYEMSVHGKLPCNSCHISVNSYPHGKPVQVKCFICHFTGSMGAPKVREYKKSVHAKALEKGNNAAAKCQDCHGSHAILPAKDNRAATSRGRVAELCSRCHAKEFNDYRVSIHGKEFLEKKNQGAAVCTDCHMEHHLIQPVTEQKWALGLIQECGTCHAEQLNTYRHTFHGKVTKLGYSTMAKCSDCHGSHRIFPKSSPESMIADVNIASTCGKCHPGATASFAKFYAHPEETNRAKYPLLFYVFFFMTSLLIGVFTFFFTHTFLWAYRAIKERKGTTEDRQ